MSSRDPSTRYYLNFDRWDPGALAGREICCSVSNCLTHSVDHCNNIWWWRATEQLWYRLDPVLEPLIRAESEFFVIQMRKALPYIRIFAESRFDGERDAAYTILCKLAAAIDAMFRLAPHDGGAKITAKDLYHGLTRDQAWQVLDLSPPEFSEDVYEALRKRDPRWVWVANGEMGGGEFAFVTPASA